MVNTKHAKVEFNQIVYTPKQEVKQSTQAIRQERIEIVKMTQKGTDEDTCYGYRKVNYSDQKMKEAYRKINKMLGGN